MIVWCKHTKSGPLVANSNILENVCHAYLTVIPVYCVGEEIESKRRGGRQVHRVGRHAEADREEAEGRQCIGARQGLCDGSSPCQHEPGARETTSAEVGQCTVFFNPSEFNFDWCMNVFS